MPFSGASVNHGRTLGSALPGTEGEGLWVYLVGPLVGGAIAYGIHRYVVVERDAAPEAPVAEVLEDPDVGRERHSRD